MSAGVPGLVISLYAKGMTTGDIQAYLAEIYQTEISRETISKITDAVVEDMQAWQSRPLDRAWFRTERCESCGCVVGCVSSHELGWGVVAEAGAWPVIEFGCDPSELVIGDVVEVTAFWEIAAEQTVGVLVGSSLPCGVRVGEVDGHAGRCFDAVVMKQLVALVPSQASTQPGWQLREWLFDHYNHVHRHSGIGLHTPASVHYGTANEIR